MNVADIKTTFAETNGCSVTIWICGCYGRCRGCCNPNLRDFTSGEELDYRELDDFIEERKGLIDSACILGGDIGDQEEDEIEELLSYLRGKGLKVWTYTRAEIGDIPEVVKRYSDYIKTGEYIEELHSWDYRFGSTNQRLYEKKEEDKFECILEHSKEEVQWQ
jgi:anaerobic ribonucleoside-triphosphate reductase activating protein